MIWRSTTFRFAALVFLLQVVGGAALLLSLAAFMRGQVAADAASSAEVLRDDLLAIHAEGGDAALARAVQLRATRVITPGAVLLLVDPAGRRVAGTLADWPPSVTEASGPVDVDLYQAGHDTAEPMRVRATRLPDGARLLTGMVVRGERRVLGIFESASVLALSLALAFAALAAWLAARLIVSRLGAANATLAAVRAGDLHRRVPADASDDAFATLGRSINGTLDRVDRLVVELKMATDGLAHDLKSPLTRLRSSLEHAAATVHEPAAQDALDRALAEGERLLAMVQTALSISRAEAGIGRESFVATDLAAELADVAEIYGPLAEDHGRAIVLDAPAGTMLAVQRELLAQAIGNLVDNSLKYGAGPIALSLVDGHGQVTIRVADAGPGIPPDRRAEALRRFGRLDEARRGSGAGLGLSLVAAVARLHGGGVRLEDVSPGLAVLIDLDRGEK